MLLLRQSPLTIFLQSTPARAMSLNKSLLLRPKPVSQPASKKLTWFKASCFSLVDFLLLWLSSASRKFAQKIWRLNHIWSIVSLWMSESSFLSLSFVFFVLIDESSSRSSLKEVQWFTRSRLNIPPPSSVCPSLHRMTWALKGLIRVGPTWREPLFWQERGLIPPGQLSSTNLLSHDRRSTFSYYWLIEILGARGARWTFTPNRLGPNRWGRMKCGYSPHQDPSY